MNVNPYLFFKGQCEEAFHFYADLLGGEIMAKMTYGEAPGCEEMPAENRNDIIHASLKVGDTLLMGGDCPPHMYCTPQGISVSLIVDTPAEADRIYNALCEGGTSQMPIAETFFAARFGMVTDRFGISWMVNCPPAEGNCPAAA